jgi:putative AbiEi antitoxin of type IV toxin-antitoxin system
MNAEAWEEVLRMLDLQSGVVSRRQVLRAGLHDHDVRRMLRRREWAVVHPGVFVTHTGRVTGLERAWAAVLSVEPAALGRQTAIDAAGKGELRDPIHVVVDRDRAVQSPEGVVLHRLARWEHKVLLNTSPPRQRVEEAVLDVASTASRELDTIAALADAVGSRLTTAQRLRTALDGRARIPRRTLLASLLDDIATGTCSTLEHAYLDRVERAHGLPSPGRQVHSSAKGSIYRDVEYEPYLLIVELDGRVGHTSTADRDRDLDRDLDAAVELERLTVRLGWGQVFERPCTTAQKLSTVLAARGWTGRPHSCPSCARPERGGSLAPGESDPPLSA